LDRVSFHRRDVAVSSDIDIGIFEIQEIEFQGIQKGLARVDHPM
jgi:hypothetical protein